MTAHAPARLLLTIGLLATCLVAGLATASLATDRPSNDERVLSEISTLLTADRFAAFTPAPAPASGPAALQLASPACVERCIDGWQQCMLSTCGVVVLFGCQPCDDDLGVCLAICEQHPI